jgi:hypothetical protein
MLETPEYLIYSPLVLIALGTIYLFQFQFQFQYNLTGQSAENFIFSTKTSVGARNAAYNKYTNLLTIS